MKDKERLRTVATEEELDPRMVDNLISAVGNHEAKALMLIAMEEGFTYSAHDLMEAFRVIQGLDKRGYKLKAWPRGSLTLFEYCEDSFFPIGMVAREVYDPDCSLTTYGYIKTKFGEDKGVPFAGLMLDFSERHPETSLLRVFGQTASRSVAKAEIETPEGLIEYKARAPITRLKIFWELLTAKLPIRCIDIAEQISEKRTVIGVHLRNLAENGIVVYESVDSNKAYSFYQLSPTRPIEFPEPYDDGRSKLPKLTKEVYEVLCLYPQESFSALQVTEVLRDNNPKRAERDKKSLITAVTRVLAYLERQGYAQKQKFGSGVMSEVNLTGEQREFLLELVDLLERFQSKDVDLFEKGRRKATEIVGDPQRVCALLEKAREASPSAHRLPKEEAGNRIRTILQERPNITIAEIHSFYKERYPRGLSKRRIRQILGYLEGKRLILAAQRGRGPKHWRATR